MKTLIGLTFLTLSSMGWAYPNCKPDLDLTNAFVFSEPATGRAAQIMEAGAISVKICKSGGKLALISQWEVTGKPGVIKEDIDLVPLE